MFRCKFQCTTVGGQVCYVFKKRIGGRLGINHVISSHCNFLETWRYPTRVQKPNLWLKYCTLVHGTDMIG